MKEVKRALLFYISISWFFIALNTILVVKIHLIIRQNVKLLIRRTNNIVLCIRLKWFPIVQTVAGLPMTFNSIMIVCDASPIFAIYIIQHLLVWWACSIWSYIFLYLLCGTQLSNFIWGYLEREINHWWKHISTITLLLTMLLFKFLLSNYSLYLFYWE